MNLKIDNNNIESSFDEIAKKLLLENALFVNDKVFRFTEIEFYYFHKEFHPDIYVHPHNRKSGEWRFHNQGIDITFDSDEKSDGGILIRGILVDRKYINGPRKILMSIFEAFGKTTNMTTFEIRTSEKRDAQIIKTFRHLPNKVSCKKFHNKKYRYIVDWDNFKDIPNNEKEEVNKDHIIVNKIGFYH